MSTTLLVGTKRGLFIVRGDGKRMEWKISAAHLMGREVYHAITDPRDGSLWAATGHAVWGAHIHHSTDGGETWETLETAPHHSDKRGLKAIWFLAPGPADEPETMYAGIEPAGLFVTKDRGRTWKAVKSLNDHETKKTWQESGGGLALGSIQIDPRDPKRMYCAISAGGVYRTDDGGKTWTPCNKGVRASFLPEPYPVRGQCVHKLVMHPLDPDRLYQQNHCGVYRSDDRGESWIEITSNLPSDFGYALTVDPTNVDVAFVIPEESSHMRATVEGKLRVYRTRDGGRNWEPLKRGLPQEHAYVSVLRDAIAHDLAEPVGVYFGTSSGQLFVSSNRGETWRMAAGFLPRILSVTAVTR